MTSTWTATAREHWSTDALRARVEELRTRRWTVDFDTREEDALELADFAHELATR
jgi:predicted TIM-barrel fold metal-dependent hydrolase